MRIFLVIFCLLFLLPALAYADNITYEEAWPVKGNVAIAGAAHVIVQSEKNEVLSQEFQKDPSRYKTMEEFINSKEGRWVGKNSSQPETVMTDGVRVSKNLADLDESKLTIIMFSPKEIRVLDLEQNRSYKYSRNPEDRIDLNKVTPAQGAAIGKWLNGGEKGADGKPVPYPVTVEQIEKAEQPTPTPAAAPPGK